MEEEAVRIDLYHHNESSADNSAILAELKEIKDLLKQANQRGSQMADTLDDVRSNLQDLGVDVDRALAEIRDGRAALEAALANSGVDEAARAEIMQMIDDQQSKIVNALNPAVPVEPNPEPVNPDDVVPSEGE